MRNHLNEFDVCSLNSQHILSASQMSTNPLQSVVLVIRKYLIVWEELKWSNDELDNN